MIIPDHYIFTSDPRANRNVDILRYCGIPGPGVFSDPGLQAFAQKICIGLACCRDVVKKYGIKYFYDITDRSDFRANPDYKGVCHVALAQEGHCKPGASFS